MNSLSLPVVHPAFQKIKRSGRLLHFAAGGLLLAHAISHFNQPHSNPVYLGCVLLIAIDIFILVFAGRNILASMPLINLFFRFIEILFFLGISITMLVAANWISGVIHLLLCLAYSYLFQCERRVHTTEYVGIHHTGITIPALPDSKFLLWAHVNRIDAHYDTISINTSLDKVYQFHLQKNLAFEELDQIHEFCRHYLGE